MSNKALNWAFAQNIKSGPKFVLVALADKAYKDGKCYQCIKTLQQLTGIASNRTVVDHLFYLEEKGLIKREIHGNGKGGREQTCFILALPQSAESTLSDEDPKVQILQPQSADFSPQSAESTHKPQYPNIPNKEKINKKEKFIPPPGISQEAADEFIQHRKNLKKPLTQNAFNRAMLQALKASAEIGITPDEAIHETIDAGWQGVKAEWLKNRLRKTNAENKSTTSTGGIALDNIWKDAAGYEANPLHLHEIIGHVWEHLDEPAEGREVIEADAGGMDGLPEWVH